MIQGGMNKDNEQDSLIQGGMDKDNEQDSLIQGGMNKDNEQDLDIAGGIVHDTYQDQQLNEAASTLEDHGTVLEDHGNRLDTAEKNIGDLNYSSHNVLNDGDDLTTSVSNLDSAVGDLNSRVDTLDGRVDTLDSRIDTVGAHAAALAALHPLDFDPDDKWDFAAGYGNFRGESAMAVGMFYRPNEDTMFSVGGSFGGSENMVNAGISFKLGQGNGVSTSRVAMAKEIKDLRKELESLKSAMVDASVGRPIDTSKLQLFPDVPQNHWAYEYVAALAGNGMIEGYPDGTFSGDRTMTRYEFAAMLYRAMLNGASLSQQILTEFAPELERFTVDVVHTDSAGNPTVERVRVANSKSLK